MALERQTHKCSARGGLSNSTLLRVVIECDDEDKIRPDSLADLYSGTQFARFDAGFSDRMESPYRALLRVDLADHHAPTFQAGGRSHYDGLWRFPFTKTDQADSTSQPGKHNHVCGRDDLYAPIAYAVFVEPIHQHGKH